MPADLKPSTYLGPGYSVGTAATGPITFGTATNATPANRVFPNLTDTEGLPASGDVRKLYWAIIEDLYNRLDAVNSAAATADKFTKMSFSKFAQTNETTGNFVYSYNFTFNLTTGTVEVVNE